MNDPALPEHPSWVRRVDRPLARAAAEVRLLGAVTPTNAERERTRMIAEVEAGGDARPRWEYARAHDSVREHLAEAEAALRGETGALAEAYAARVAEVRLEAEMATVAGTPRLGALARRRFAASSFASAASELARQWIAAPPDSQRETIRSDAPDPRSLLSRMRAAVGERKLPFSVVARDGLAPLAATGERTILVACRRDVTEEDALRTVLHEIEGHAMPRVRARSRAIGLFGIGTARGADEQEGYALLLEERAGFATPRRRRQLAARHLAVEAMLGGATFADVTRMLVDRGIDARAAVLAAERAFRGGDGACAGLGRERVYVEALLRVRAHLDAHSEHESVVSSGQVAIGSIDALIGATR